MSPLASAGATFILRQEPLLTREHQIEFPVQLADDRGRVVVRCSESVRAAWTTAVSCLATRSEAMVVAYLREAIHEAAGEARKPIAACIEPLPEPERSVAQSIASHETDPEAIGSNHWLLFRATFAAIRSAYGD